MSCRDCKYHKSNRGKCNRWEKKCPFEHLKKENIHLDLMSLKYSRENIKSTLEKISNLKNNDCFKDIINYLKLSVEYINFLTDKELIEEYKWITTNKRIRKSYKKTYLIHENGNYKQPTIVNVYRVGAKNQKEAISLMKQKVGKHKSFRISYEVTLESDLLPQGKIVQNSTNKEIV